MLCYLEDMIEDFFRLNNANWRRLLGCWLVGQGCLRYRRLSLSTPVKLTVLTLHAHCARGKQAHNRAGFDWSVPVKFASGFCWGEHGLREYQQLSPEMVARAGFCFRCEGVPFTIRDVQDAARNIFQGYAEPLEGLTTYSFR